MYFNFNLDIHLHQQQDGKKKLNKQNSTKEQNLVH